MSEHWDDDGYPTEEFLERVRTTATTAGTS